MLPLQHHFTAIVAGPAGCGKSEWVLQLIGHAKKMIEPPPEEIWRCYGEFQPIFARYPEVKFHEGMPDFTKFDCRRSTLVVIIGQKRPIITTHVLSFERSHERNERRRSKSVHQGLASQKRQRDVSDTKPILQKQAHAYHQSELSLYDTVQKSTRCTSVFHFGSADVSQQLEVCRRSVSRRHEKTIWLSVSGLET